MTVDTRLIEARARAFDPIDAEGIFESLRARPEWLTLDVLRAYLSHFVASETCPLCGSWGTSHWGIVHGAMTCSRCGYPSRMYHFIRPPEGVEVDRYRVVGHLWAHPNEVTTKGEQA